MTGRREKYWTHFQCHQNKRKSEYTINIVSWFFFVRQEFLAKIALGMRYLFIYFFTKSYFHFYSSFIAVCIWIDFGEVVISAKSRPSAFFSSDIRYHCVIDTLYFDCLYMHMFLCLIICFILFVCFFFCMFGCWRGYGLVQGFFWCLYEKFRATKREDFANLVVSYRMNQEKVTVRYKIHVHVIFLF